MQEIIMTEIFLIISCCILCVILFKYVNKLLPRVARIMYNKRFHAIDASDIQLVIKNVRNATINELKKDFTQDHIIYYSKSFTDFCAGKKISVYEYGEYGLLLYYSCIVAQKTGDIEMMDLVRRRFDEGLDIYLKRIVRSDQISYGLVAIELYLYTHDDRYHGFANAVYNRCVAMADENGLILYRNQSIEQHVDALGFIPKFLCLYGEVFSVDNAIKLAETLVYDYMENGVDKNTGFPCQTYRIYDKIKINRANWSRGCAWYMLGVTSLPSLSPDKEKMYQKLVNILTKDSPYKIQQYFCQGASPDISAVIPILYVLSNNEHFQVSTSELIKNIGPYIRKDGRVCNMSPSIVLPYEGPQLWNGGMFYNAMLLNLLTQTELVGKSV